MIVYLPASPSHTVGLEQELLALCRLKVASRHPTRWAWNIVVATKHGSTFLVTIPHGGLRTKGGFTMIVYLPASPSHTVGLEQELLALCRLKVASRHPTRWAWN
jgi:hypothetical protein